MLNFLKVLTLFALSAVIILYISRKDNPFTKTPYPVKVTGVPEGLDQAEKAHILIIGSGIAEYITPIIEEIGESYKDKVRGGLKIVNWAEQNEGIHRTLFKWQSLKKKPLITIYLGGDSEFYEQKFMVRDIEKIKKNFKRSENLELSTLLQIVPELSPFFYIPISHFIYASNKNPLENNKIKIMPDRLKLKYIEFNYFVYKSLLNELIYEVKKFKKEIILLSPPYNPENEPNQTCSIASSETIIEILEEIEELKKENKKQEAYDRLRLLSEKALGHAGVFYKRAQVEKELKNHSLALRLFELSHAFDCLPSNATKITESIIEKAANNNGIPFINFSRLIFRNFGKGPLFLDERIPQEKYFDLIKNLIQKEVSEQLQL